MKSSNDNTPLLVGLFVLAAIIIALIVYYTRPGETKTSEQTSDTTELKIENLSFSRTLNPDPSASSGTSGYTIEPYGVEYATGDDQYKELSKNVTFTMTWTNSPGFNGVVKGFKIKHYVKATGATSYPTNANQTLIKKPDDKILITDFGSCSADIVSNGEYLVIGQNSFKLYAVVEEDDKTFDWNTSNTQKDVLLYNGNNESPDPDELNIKKSQLSVTLTMTKSETISYTPESITSTTTSTVIEKTAYKITNNAATLNIGQKGLYLSLIPQTLGKHFNFTYEDGEYLLDNLTKGAVSDTRTKFKFEIVDKDGNVGKIRQVSSETDDSKSKFLSSDGTTLKLYTKTDQNLNATKFAGFKWTFASWNPVDCEGTYDNNWSACSNNCGSGTQTKKYNVTQQPNDMGKACLADQSQTCSSDAGCDVDCVGNWSSCVNPNGNNCGDGIQTYNVEKEKKNAGATCKDNNNNTVEDGATKTCWLGSCGYGAGYGGLAGSGGK